MSCTFRLTSRQSQLLSIGIRPIWLAHTSWRHTGSFPAPHPGLYLELINDRDGYDEKLMQCVLRMANTLFRMHDRGGRLYLSEYSEIAALQLAVRVAREQLRHGHVKAWAPRQERTFRNVLRRLDALRCRVKRALIARCGKQAFDEAARQWRAFAHWMRLRFLYCRCKWRIRNPVYRMRRRRLDMLCERAEAGLRFLEAPIPPRRELRRLVRQFVRYVRRDRTPYTLGTLVNHPEFAASRLADYVIHHRGGNRAH